MLGRLDAKDEISHEAVSACNATLAQCRLALLAEARADPRALETVEHAAARLMTLAAFGSLTVAKHCASLITIMRDALAALDLDPPKAIELIKPHNAHAGPWRDTAGRLARRREPTVKELPPFSPPRRPLKGHV